MYFVATILGKDRKGLVAQLTKVIADANANIVDIEQSVIHGLFSMFMVVDCSTSKITKAELQQQLATKCKALGMDLTLKDVEKGYKKREKNLYQVTLLSVDKPGIVAKITKAITDLNGNIERIKMIAREDLFAIQMRVDSNGDLTKLKQQSEKDGFDIVIQLEKDSKYRKKLIAFDLDSTLIDMEIIDEIAKYCGVSDKVSQITELTMQGKISFQESLKQRVNLFKGLPITVLEEVAKNIKFNPGAEELIRTLKSMGFKLALISGSFSYFTEKIKDKLKFDYAFGNELVIKNNRLTGQIKEPIIDADMKGKLIEKLAKIENISKEEIIAIGDGANDSIMLQNAGLGIGFNPKPALRNIADGSINNIKSVLHLI